MKYQMVSSGLAVTRRISIRFTSSCPGNAYRAMHTVVRECRCPALPWVDGIPFDIRGVVVRCAAGFDSVIGDRDGRTTPALH